jgi:hypothetical protein
VILETIRIMFGKMAMSLETMRTILKYDFEEGGF